MDQFSTIRRVFFANGMARSFFLYYEDRRERDQKAGVSGYREFERVEKRIREGEGQARARNREVILGPPKRAQWSCSNWCVMAEPQYII